MATTTATIEITRAATAIGTDANRASGYPIAAGALSLLGRSGPRREQPSPHRATPYGIFQRAIQRRNVLAAVAAAWDLPQLSLLDALDLTLLVARKDPRRHPRLAARWLLRFLEEDPQATIEEAALAASCLAALPGATYREAAQTLKGMAERATSRRRTGDVA